MILGAYKTAHPSYLLSNGTLTATKTTNNGTITQSSGTASLGPVNGTGSISITGGQLSANYLRQSSLSLGGTAQIVITPGGGNAGVSRLAALSFDPASTAKFDLADNALVVDYSTTSPVPAIRSALSSAYANGAWTDPGITSSSAAANHSHGLSYVEAAEALGLSGPSTATWNGQTVDATTVLVSYSLVGDANLDSTVGFADLVKLAQNYGRADGSADWFQGDFNYDGNIDFADLVKLAQNYGAGAPPLMAGALANFQGDLAAAFSNLPEPFGMLLLPIAGFILTQRGRAPLDSARKRAS